MKVPVGTFNQEKALLGAFSVIVETDELFAALANTLTSPHTQHDVYRDTNDVTLPRQLTTWPLLRRFSRSFFERWMPRSIVPPSTEGKL